MFISKLRDKDSSVRNIKVHITCSQTFSCIPHILTLLKPKPRQFFFRNANRFLRNRQLVLS